jgi:hypothetical protein
MRVVAIRLPNVIVTEPLPILEKEVKNMESHILSCGEIKILQEDIAEVIVNDMVEMDISMVEEYHAFLLKELKAPFSLLVNKKYSYTYTFEAQTLLANLPEINTMAVISYNQQTEAITKGLIEFPRDLPWNIQLFRHRDAALDWLKNNQQQLTKVSS